MSGDIQRSILTTLWFTEGNREAVSSFLLDAIVKMYICNLSSRQKRKTSLPGIISAIALLHFFLRSLTLLSF